MQTERKRERDKKCKERERELDTGRRKVRKSTGTAQSRGCR